MAKEMGVIVTRYSPEKESWRQKGLGTVGTNVEM